jgi:tetratricopeptide (TPR) repeat protein
MAWDQNKFNKALDKGHSAAWDQNWDEAIKHYRAALLEFPDNPAALTSLGLALTEKGDLEGALQCYQHAAQVNPEDAVAISSLARMYEMLGRQDEAVSAFMQAAELYLKNHLNEKAIENFIAVINLQPTNLNARIRLSTVYDGMDMKPDAISEYLAAASLLQKNGDEEKALQLVNHVLTIQPENPEANKALQSLENHKQLPLPAQTRGRTGLMGGSKKQPDAQKEILEQVEKDPIAEAQHLALVSLAGVLFEKDDEAAVAGQVSRKSMSNLTRGTGGLSSDHSAKSRMQLHLGKAIDFQTQGDEVEAALELERAIEIGTKLPAAFFDLGLLYVHTDSEKSMKYLKQSVGHPDFSLGSYLLMAGIHKENGELNAAATEYLHALALADITTVPEEKSDELKQLYDPIIESQERETDMEKLNNLCNSIQAQILRKDWRAHLNSIRQQLSGGQEEEELPPIAGMLLEMKGSRVVDAMAEIRKLEQKGHYRSAMEVALDTIPFSPVYLPLHVKIGDLLVKEGHLPGAVEKFITTADLYHARGETSQAISLLKRVTTIVSMDLEVRGKLIEFLNSQGRIEEVLNEYMDLAKVYYQLAELDMARKTCLTGAKLAQEAPNRQAWVVKFLNRIADIDMQRLDWRNAIKVYEQLCSMQPEEPSSRVKLIDLNLRLGQNVNAISEADSYVSYLQKGGQRDLPIGFLREMSKEHPDVLEFQRRLADLLIKDEKLPEAIKVLDYVAKTLVQSGNKNAAVETLKLILKLNPPNIQEYQNAINKLAG